MEVNMIRKLTVSLFSLVLISMLAACGSQNPVSLPDQDPGEVVQAFYDWYLGDRSGPPKDARESGFLADELVAQITENLESPVPVDQINFVCAQDFPEFVEVVSSEVSGEEAEVHAETSFGTNIRFDLQAVDGQWRIVDVNCE